MSAILDTHIAEFMQQVERHVRDPHMRANMKAKIKIVAIVAKREAEKECQCKQHAPVD